MKNPIRLVEWPIGRIILILWILFSIFYIGNGVWNNVLMRVYQSGKNEGVKSAVTQALDLAQKCQPVVLSVGETQVNLLNPNCFQKEATSTTETTEDEK